uniref:Uncharacterized protein n=1 Tax=Anguilla anguilla TaxID=7936 RepID=A0A0E9QSP7_ANGAN
MILLDWALRRKL